MSTEKWIQREEVITFSAMHGAIGLRECYLIRHPLYNQAGEKV